MASHFEVYFKTFDDFTQLLFSYDYDAKVCYVGIDATGRRAVISAPLPVWELLVDQIQHATDLNGGNCMVRNDDWAITVRTRDGRHNHDIDIVAFTQPKSKIPEVFSKACPPDRYLENGTASYIEMTLNRYRQFVCSLKTAIPLFAVIELTQPPSHYDEVVISTDFPMKFRINDLRIDVVIKANRAYEHLTRDVPFVNLESVASKREIRLTDWHLREIEKFNLRMVLNKPNHGMLVLKDIVGNPLRPVLVVYPPIADMNLAKQTKLNSKLIKHPHKSYDSDEIYFTYNEWQVFMKIVVLFFEMRRDEPYY